MFLGFTAAPGRAADEDTVKAESAEECFTIETRHRMYPGFSQMDTVAVEQSFYIGEEEEEARIVEFNPHLMLTMESRAVARKAWGAHGGASFGGVLYGDCAVTVIETGPGF